MALTRLKKKNHAILRNDDRIHFMFFSYVYMKMKKRENVLRMECLGMDSFCDKISFLVGQITNEIF